MQESNTQPILFFYLEEAPRLPWPPDGWRSPNRAHSIQPRGMPSFRRSAIPGRRSPVFACLWSCHFWRGLEGRLATGSSVTRAFHARCVMRCHAFLHSRAEFELNLEIVQSLVLHVRLVCRPRVRRPVWLPRKTQIDASPVRRGPICAPSSHSHHPMVL